MKDEVVVVYGTSWCMDCIRTRRWLKSKGISYRWVNIDQDKDGERYVLQVNRGMRSVPTIRFADGCLLVEPSNIELQKKFELK